jgi:hypothetical protein
VNAEDFEVYPINHKGKVYSLITPFDLSFPEVRSLLDALEARGAFSPSPEDDFMGPGKLFTLDVAGIRYELDVQGYEVVIYRRSP